MTSLLRSVFFLILTCGVPALFAQNGNLAGTVTESSRHDALVGAEITVEGQSFRATTDESGRYLILGVPSGTAKITAAYLGMEPLTQDVTIPAGGTATLDVALSPATVRTSVTVSAEPDLVGQARALNDQKNSINLINLVASDQIGAFPDPNAAEAAQRIPGIIVQRDQGEGRYVLIRGTEPRLSATTINGVRIGTTENTSRQIPLDTIPADLLGAIEVTKALLPEMEGDSIGGRVNLITKRAPATRHVTLTFGSGFNTLVKNDIKDYNATYGQRLFHDKLGFIGSGNFYQNNRGSQDLEPTYTGTNGLNALDLRDYVLTRTRSGYTGDIDYRLGAGSEIYIRGLRSEYEDSELRHRLRDIVSNSRMERLLRDRYHDSTQIAIMTGGSHTLPSSWLFTWTLAYSNAALNTPYRLESTFRQNGVTFAPNVTPGSIDPSNIQANPQNQNLNSFSFIQNAIQNDRGRERNLSGGFDISAPARLGARANGLLKFGLKVRDANRTRDVDSITQTAPTGVAVPFLSNTDPDYKPADNYLGGKYTEFGTAFPDVSLMRAISRGGTLRTVYSPTGDSGSYRAKERVTAGYVQDEISLGERTTILPGIRFEATDTNYGAPQYLQSTGGLARSYVQGKNTYLNVLPGIHLRHMLFTDTPLRVSFNRSLARPNYSDLAPFVLQDNTALTVSRGNPDLKVTTSNNFDASVEHYFKNVGIAAVGYFYKNLGNYIYMTTTQSTLNGGSDLYRITQPINGQSAHLQGVEFTLSRNLDFLPSVFRNLSTYANYTHVTSEATLPRGKSILPGQASNMGNVSLAFNRWGFEGRISFNYQGRYIMGIGDTAAADTWLDNRLEIDMSASQRIGKHTRLFIDMLNLGNNPYRVYSIDTKHPIQEERYKIWAITGVKFEF
ncbi:MAG: TonB-dependent receptor [Acidobacteriota bacterium]